MTPEFSLNQEILSKDKKYIGSGYLKCLDLKVEFDFEFTDNNETKNRKNIYNYKGKIYKEINKVSNNLSDNISKDLRKRGMKFVGTIIIYSYLQAIGVINSHEKECFKHE